MQPTPHVLSLPTIYRRVGPGDFLATIYRHLGFDLEVALSDFSGRPQLILPRGAPIPELKAKA